MYNWCKQNLIYTPTPKWSLQWKTLFVPLLWISKVSYLPIKIPQTKKWFVESRCVVLIFGSGIYPLKLLAFPECYRTTYLSSTLPSIHTPFVLVAPISAAPNGACSIFATTPSSSLLDFIDPNWALLFSINYLI